MWMYFLGVHFNDDIKKNTILLNVCVVQLVQSNQVWQRKKKYFPIQESESFFYLTQ